MTIQRKNNGSTVVLTVSGRLDSSTAPELEKAVEAAIPDADQLVFCLSGLEYCSSAGLRVLVNAYKLLRGAGKTMRIADAGKAVCELIALTGMDEILKVG